MKSLEEIFGGLGAFETISTGTAVEEPEEKTIPEPTILKSQKVDFGGDIDKIVQHYATEYGVDPKLASAVIKHESGGDPRAVGADGEIGLMQILPSTGRVLAQSFGEEYSIRNLMDPEKNVKYGIKYLSEHFKKYGKDIPKVLSAYNAGPGNVDKAIQSGKNIPDYTRGYVKSVLTNMGVSFEGKAYPELKSGKKTLEDIFGVFGTLEEKQPAITAEAEPKEKTEPSASEPQPELFGPSLLQKKIAGFKTVDIVPHPSEEKYMPEIEAPAAETTGVSKEIISPQDFPEQAPARALGKKEYEVIEG